MDFKFNTWRTGSKIEYYQYVHNVKYGIYSLKYCCFGSCSCWHICVVFFSNLHTASGTDELEVAEKIKKKCELLIYAIMMYCKINS